MLLIKDVCSINIDLEDFPYVVPVRTRSTLPAEASLDFICFVWWFRARCLSIAKPINLCFRTNGITRPPKTMGNRFIDIRGKAMATVFFTDRLVPQRLRKRLIVMSDFWSFLWLTKRFALVAHKQIASSYNERRTSLQTWRGKSRTPRLKSSGLRALPCGTPLFALCKAVRPAIVSMKTVRSLK